MDDIINAIWTLSFYDVLRIALIVNLALAVKAWPVYVGIVAVKVAMIFINKIREARVQE